MKFKNLHFSRLYFHKNLRRIPQNFITLSCIKCSDRSSKSSVSPCMYRSVKCSDFVVFLLTTHGLLDHFPSSTETNASRFINFSGEEKQTGISNISPGASRIRRLFRKRISIFPNSDSDRFRGSVPGVGISATEIVTEHSSSVGFRNGKITVLDFPIPAEICVASNAFGRVVQSDIWGKKVIFGKKRSKI